MKSIYLFSLFYLFSQVLCAQWQLPANMYADSAYAPFLIGVASGDPKEDGVIVWTHITPDSATAPSITLDWELAYDTSFLNPVQAGTYTTDASRDWTIGIAVENLDAYTTYYYRFRAPNGNYSRIGRTRTAPDSSTNVNHIRLGIASCSSVFSGYFNGYKRLSERLDMDAIVHLGDYIYDFVDPDEQVRIPTPYPQDPTNKQEWRARHYYYLLDPDLRAARQMHPWIVLWDNHDTDYKGSGVNPQESREAFLEYVPIRLPDRSDTKKIYRRLSYGSLLDIFIADILLYKDVDQVPGGGPSRLGTTQYAWLTNGLQASTAKWKIVGNQKMMGDWSVAAFPFLFLPVLQALGLANGGVLTTSTWDGYDEARDQFLDYLENNNIDNVIVLSGDSHLSMGTDLTQNPFGSGYNGNNGTGSVAVEFLPTSISRGNFDEMGFPNATVGLVKTYTDASNPHHVFSEITSHGYGILDIKTDSTRAEYWYSDILTITNTETYGHGLLVKDSENHWHRTSMSTPSDPKDYSSTIITLNTPKIEKTAARIQLHVFPNPSKGKFTLSFELQKAKEITISVIEAASGSVLKTISKQNYAPNQLQQIQLDISHLPAGTYFLSLQGEGVETGILVVKE